MKSKHFNLVLKENIRNEFIVTSVLPDYAWENGVATERIKGWKLRTVCPSAAYDETMIKMEVEKPPLEPEAVEVEPVLVSFVGLEFSSYHSSITKRTEFTGKATGLKVLRQG